jgi:spermidine synthase
MAPYRSVEVHGLSSRIAFLIGWLALQGQVTLLREVGIALGGNETVYALGAGAWLIGVALGRLHHPRGGVRMGAGGGLLVLAWAILPLLVVARATAFLPGRLAAEPDLPSMLAVVALCLGPAGFLTGAMLRGTAGTWALVSGGAMLGGMVATLVTALGGGGLAGALAGALVVGVGVATDGGEVVGRRILALGLGTVALVGVLAAPGIEAWATGWDRAGHVATLESAVGRVTAVSRDGGHAVLVDEALAYESQGTTAEEFVALAAVQRDAVGDVLVLGGWVEGLAGELAPYAPRRVDLVEVDDAPLRLLADRLAGRPGRDDVVVADPRRYLATAGGLDLILSALPEPSSGRANRYATAEFFAQCAAALREGGVLAVRLRTAANLWTPRQAHRAAAMHAALGAVFADVVVLPGTETVFLASAQPLSRDTDLLVVRLERAAPPTRVVSGSWLAWRYTSERTAELGALLRQATVPANRDRRPSCYADAIMLDLAHILPGIGWHSPPAAGRWLWFALVVLLPPAILARRRAGATGRLLAGYAGLAGTGLTMVLLLHDQTARGVLYRDLGAALAVGALGLALGTWLGERQGRQPAQRWRRPVLAAGTSFWNCVVAFAMLAGAGGLIFTALGVLGTGLLTGLLLTAAVADGREDARATLAAAALGGAGGVLLAALFLVPFAGLPAAALAVAVLAFPAVVAVWPAAGPPMT